MKTTEWPEVSLEEICDSIDYGFTTSAQGAIVGPKFLRITDIVSGYIDWLTVPYCSIEARQMNSFKLHHGDIVIARTGATTGFSAYIADPPDAVFASYLVRLKIGTRADPRFVSYFLKTSDFWEYMYGVLGDKSAQPNASAKTMTQVRLGLPPLAEQRSIAAILGSLDDKIELNRRMNATLEGLARAIFLSWFVDFDPVRAKMEGRRPAGMDEATAALFPDRFEESELGEIPAGWKVGSIYDVAKVVYGFPFASKFFNSEVLGMPLIRIRDLVTGQPETFTTESYPEAAVVSSGDVVVGMDGEFKVCHWRGSQALLNQRVCKFQPHLEISRFFISNSIAEPLAFFERSKVGTTVIHLGKADIDTIRLIIPSLDILKAFAQITEPLLDRILINTAESRTLAALRDTLLPKLLSGEVRVG